MGYYNRYRKINNDENITSPPFIKLDEKDTDAMIIYDVRKTRLDKVSQEYYGAPFYSWLILIANPEFGGLEWNIKDGQAVRIPLPLDLTLNEYERKLIRKIEFYG
jgi:hypothetical protein